LVVSALWAAAILAGGGQALRAALALAPIALVMLDGLLVRAPYADRKDMSPALWLVVPLVGHALVALAFLLAINPTMRWGRTTLEFNKDGTIREMRTPPDLAADES
jgi:hypothetical protein